MELGETKSSKITKSENINYMHDSVVDRDSNSTQEVNYHHP